MEILLPTRRAVLKWARQRVQRKPREHAAYNLRWFTLLSASVVSHTSTGTARTPILLWTSNPRRTRTLELFYATSRKKKTPYGLIFIECQSNISTHSAKAIAEFLLPVLLSVRHILSPLFQNFKPAELLLSSSNHSLTKVKIVTKTST